MINSNKKDNRMAWVLALDEYQEAIWNKIYTMEYEICSEVRIPGVLDYGNGFLICSLFQSKDQNNLYTYLIRVKHHEEEFKFDKNNYSKEGYYLSKNGLIDELIVLFSVYFQARFYLKATIMGELTSKSIRMRTKKGFQYKKVNPFRNFEMFSDQERKRNWATENGLKLFLDKIKTLDQIYHQNLISSFYWYAGAIKEIGVDHQLFFIKMVSTIEALLKFINIQPDELENKLKKLIKNNYFSKDEKNKIESWLNSRRINQKFVEFLKKYSNGFFEEEEQKFCPDHCRIKKEELCIYAKRIYNARSKYLHEGKPIFVSDDYTMEESKYCDLDYYGGDVYIDRKKIIDKEKLPRVKWFERIINYCLKEFIEDTKTTHLKKK